MAFQSVGVPQLGNFNIQPIQTPQAPQMFGVNIAEKYMEGLAAKRDMEARARQQAIQEEQLAIQREGQALKLKQMQESANAAKLQEARENQFWKMAFSVDPNDPNAVRDLMLAGSMLKIQGMDTIAKQFDSGDISREDITAGLKSLRDSYAQGPEVYESTRKQLERFGIKGVPYDRVQIQEDQDPFTPKPQGNAFVVVGGKARPVVQLEGSGGYAMVNGQGQYVPVPAGAEIQFGEIAGTPEQFDPSKLKETQSKGFQYGSRMNQANEILTQLEEGVAGMSFFEGLKRAGEKAVVGSDAFNRLASEQVQRMDQAQRNFINAVLRRESGAVISPQEFENARKQYFVVPGDTEATVRQKQQNRELATKNMLLEAGAPLDSGTTGEVIGGTADQDITHLLDKYAPQ